MSESSRPARRFMGSGTQMPQSTPPAQDAANPPLTVDAVRSMRFSVSKPHGYYFPQVEDFVAAVVSTLTFFERRDLELRNQIHGLNEDLVDEQQHAATLQTQIELFRVQGDPLVHADGAYVTESQTDQSLIAAQSRVAELESALAAAARQVEEAQQRLAAMEERAVAAEQQAAQAEQRAAEEAPKAEAAAQPQAAPAPRSPAPEPEPVEVPEPEGAVPPAAPINRPVVRAPVVQAPVAQAPAAPLEPTPPAPVPEPTGGSVFGVSESPAYAAHEQAPSIASEDGYVALIPADSELPEGTVIPPTEPPHVQFNYNPAAPGLPLSVPSEWAPELDD